MMEKGKKFYSFDEFQVALDLFFKSTNTFFVKRTTESIRENSLKHLKHEAALYVCKHGQSKHPRTSTGQRPCQKSLKLGCPAKLRIKVQRPKDQSQPHLAVTVLDLNHQGHDVTAEAFSLIPERRRVELNSATALLTSTSLKALEVKRVLEQQHNVCLTRHDVYNIKKRVNVHRDDNEECAQRMKEIEDSGGVVYLAKDESENFKFLLFMTNEMRQIIQTFPEVVILDVTYKTNVYLYPLLTAMVINGEGHGIPIMHAFLSKEDKNSMEHCLRLFKQQYTFASTKCFVVDKDMAEISAIEAVFPETPVNLCCFHINQAVKRFLVKELPSETVKTVLDMFMSQVYTESEEEFNEYIIQITEIVPQSVTDYFRKNWWGKSSLWAACKNIHVVKLHATTTNHLESYHSKINKSLCEKITLSKALSELMHFDNAKIGEHDRQKVIASNCLTYDQRDVDSVSKKITQTVTQFSASLLKCQLACARKTQYSICLLHGCTYSISYREKKQETTAEHCSCSFFNHMRLPCRHIFALRDFLGLDIFSEQLVPDRFKLITLPGDHIYPTCGEGTFIVVPSQSNYKTQEGRFRKAKSICDSIASHLTVLGEQEFKEKIEHLEVLLDMWCSSTSEPHPIVVSEPIDVVAAPSSSDITQGVQQGCKVVKKSKISHHGMVVKVVNGGKFAPKVVKIEPKVVQSHE